MANRRKNSVANDLGKKIKRKRTVGFICKKLK